MRAFLLKTEGEAEEDTITAVEIARFRLLSYVLKKSGNDDQCLGVHDANLIYINRNTLDLGQPEHRTLSECGLHHLSSPNVPLWHWLFKFGDSKIKLLTLTSMYGPSQTRVGALIALDYLDAPLPIDEFFQRSAILDRWLSVDSPNPVRVAALKYLKRCGNNDDLPAIKEELLKSDYATRAEATEAIIAINFRIGREEGIRAIYEYQPETIRPTTLDLLFKSPRSLSSSVLTEALSHRCLNVREKSAELLLSRRAISVETAEKLMTDNSSMVRYSALRALMDSGRAYSEAEAKAILVKQNVGLGIGLAGIWGQTDNQGQECFELFCQRRLEALTKRELEELASSEAPFSIAARLLLIDRAFKKRGDELRKLLNDQFEAFVTEGLATLERTIGASEPVDQAKRLDEFLRKKFTRQALDVVCQKSQSCDLELVRRTVTSGFVSYKKCDLDFIRKHGDWSDVQLLINLSDQATSQGGYNLLSIGNTDYQSLAKAICGLSRGRAEDLFGLQMSSQLLGAVIRELPDKDFDGLSDNTISTLFASDSGDTRKIAALKAVRALSQRRLKNLLEAHLCGTKTVYYNVIHWLDAGITLPRPLAISVATRLLKPDN